MRKKWFVSVIFLCCLIINCCASTKGNEYCKYPERDQEKEEQGKHATFTILFP